MSELAPVSCDQAVIDRNDNAGVTGRAVARSDTAWRAETFGEDPDSRVHLCAPVSLLVHLETMLGWQRGRVRHDRSLALTGSLHLPELRAEIGFCGHHGHGSGNGHAEVQWQTASIIPQRATMPIPVHDLPMRAPEDSDVWALIPAPDHDPAWTEHYAGQLDGEPFRFDQHVRIDVTLDMTFTLEDESNGHEPKLAVAGELRFEPLHMRFLLRDPEQAMGNTSEFDSGEAELIVAGARVPIRRQVLSRRLGPNRSMTVRVVEVEGRVVQLERSLTGPTRSAT